MRNRSLLVLAMLSSIVAAGCIDLGTAVEERASPSATAYPDIAAVAELVEQTHDHADPALHLAGFLNFEALGRHNGWRDDDTYPAGGNGVNELAVWGNLVFASRHARLGGFSILDFSDPANPTMLGEFLSEGNVDIEVSADGDWVFTSSQRTLPSADNLQEKPVTGNMHRGVYVVDVRDKTAPRFESFFPLPTNGPHTNTYFCDGARTDAGCDGRELMLVQTYDLIPGVATGDLLGAVPFTQRIYITEFTTLPDGRRGLELLGQWNFMGVPGAGEMYLPHDSAVQRHPFTGQLLLYAAYWDAGLVILDISDAANPTLVSRYTDFAPTRLKALHYAEPFPVLIEGRHVTAVAPEIVTADEAGQITFLDTTDPSNPTQIGYWSVGDLVVDEPFIFSPHNFAYDCRDVDPFTGELGRFDGAQGLAGGTDSPVAIYSREYPASPERLAQALPVHCRLAFAHNHAGAWELDVSTLDLIADPPVTGYAFPVPEDGCRGRCVTIWGVRYLHDGSLVVSDAPTGMWLLRSTFGSV